MNYKIISSEELSLAKALWDYLQLNQEPEKADCILTLGSHDLRVAERAAGLFLSGYAPVLIFSGGLGNLTRDLWDEPEADKFAKVAMKMGVPKGKILIENRSENTGENIQFSYQLIQKRKIRVRKLILVQKPYMERRSFATFKKQWPDPGTSFWVTSPKIDFKDYPNDKISMKELINIMVGDLQRIELYPKLGFQIPQEIPWTIKIAFKRLVSKGFSDHLVKQ